MMRFNFVEPSVSPRSSFEMTPAKTLLNKKSVPKYGKLSIGLNKPIDAFIRQTTQLICILKYRLQI